MLFPIIPTRSNNKLLFILCNVCGHLKQSNCYHSDDERAIEGTWISEEVKHAIKNGYQMIKIFSIWHFNQKEVYDKQTKTGGLFTEYVNKFLKMKTEATGFPDHIK